MTYSRVHLIKLNQYPPGMPMINLWLRRYSQCIRIAYIDDQMTITSFIFLKSKLSLSKICHCCLGNSKQVDLHHRQPTRIGHWEQESFQQALFDLPQNTEISPNKLSIHKKPLMVPTIYTVLTLALKFNEISILKFSFRNEIKCQKYMHISNEWIWSIIYYHILNYSIITSAIFSLKWSILCQYGSVYSI